MRCWCWHESKNPTQEDVWMLQSLLLQLASSTFSDHHKPSRSLSEITSIATLQMKAHCVRSRASWWQWIMCSGAVYLPASCFFRSNEDCSSDIFPSATLTTARRLVLRGAMRQHTTITNYMPAPGKLRSSPASSQNIRIECVKLWIAWYFSFGFFSFFLWFLE